MSSSKVQRSETEIVRLYRAPFVVTGNGVVIEDGAVSVRAGRITGVDRFVRLAGDRAAVIDCEGHILTPALVNCHAHLELSWMADLPVVAVEAEAGDMTAWIKALLDKRDRFSPSDEAIMEAARRGLTRLHQSGTILVGDIGNRPVSVDISPDGLVEVHFFLEMMGLTPSAAQSGLERLNGWSGAATAHGPYSTNPLLIQELHRRAVSRGEIFPIHIAESADEVEFLESGQGRFYSFLNDRLREVSECSEGQNLIDLFEAPGCRALEYLERLGVLDENTLCVHVVHVIDSEIDLLAAKNAKVCLCPRSNRHIGVGTAPLEKFLANGILPGLGTDSLASNETLNIFAEMSALAEDHPGVDPQIIFAMATRGGAIALNRSADFGTIEVGKRAELLALEIEGLALQEVYPYLASIGDGAQVRWLGELDG